MFVYTSKYIMEISNILNENLAFVSNSFSRYLNEIATDVFADIGLIPSEAFLLLIVNSQVDIQPKELSKKIRLAPSTVTRAIEKLERRSLISRRQESKFVYLNPTSKSLDLNSAIIKKMHTIQEKIMQKLSTDGYKTILSTISHELMKFD
jgi:MarR family transcriptional regulator, organic hydroperoxide resistance regulator